MKKEKILFAFNLIVSGFGTIEKLFARFEKPFWKYSVKNYNLLWGEAQPDEPDDVRRTDANLKLVTHYFHRTFFKTNFFISFLAEFGSFFFHSATC